MIECGKVWHELDDHEQDRSRQFHKRVLHFLEIQDRWIIWIDISLNLAARAREVMLQSLERNGGGRMNKREYSVLDRAGLVEALTLILEGGPVVKDNST